MKSLTHYTKGTPSPTHQIAQQFAEKNAIQIAMRFEGRALTACKHSVSGTVSLPSSGCFSPFPHGTSSLSVVEEYLGLEGGPPMFRQDCTCPALLEDAYNFTATGLSPAMARLSNLFALSSMHHWPGPGSLATTTGVSVDVLSSRY